MNDKNEQRNTPKVAPCVFNTAGKTPSSATFTFTVDEVRENVFNLAKQYFENLSKDRVMISLVTDTEYTRYNKETKTNEPMTTVVIALYFDINDNNFVTSADNIFAPTVMKSNDKVKKFIDKFGVKGNDGNSHNTTFIDRGSDGRRYRCLVLDTARIFEHIMDASGYGYEQQYGQRGPRVIVGVEVFRRKDGGRVSIDHFEVSKSLYVEPKAGLTELNAKKLRGRMPRHEKRY